MTKKDVQIGGRPSDGKDQLQGISKIYAESASESGQRGRLSAREGDPDDSHRGSQSATGLVLVVSVIALIAIALIAWAWTRQPEQGTAAGEGSSSLDGELSTNTLDYDRSVALVKRAISVKQADEASRYFLLGSSKPEDVVGYLDQLALPSANELTFRWVRDGIDRAYTSVIVEWQPGVHPDRRLAAIRKDAQGEWKVDFEAFACVSHPEWEVIASGKVDSGEIRVIIQKDSYYNGRFQEAAWTCYRMESFSSEEPMYGYVRNGSIQDAALKRIFKVSNIGSLEDEEKGETVPHAYLSIQRSEGDLDRQFEIKRVLAKGWVMAEVPYEEWIMKSSD